MTRRKRTIGLLVLAIAMAGVTACGDSGAGPVAPSTVGARPAPPSGPVSGPGQLMAISGTVTEMTANGPVPLKDAYVEVCGYDSTRSNERGFYSLTSVPSETPYLYVQKAGYKARSVTLKLSPDGRLDIRLERE